MANFRFENTPNPNTIKINSDILLHAGTIEYHKDKASSSDFAKEVFSIDGIKSIFILKDFLTVTKEDNADFNDITPYVVDTMNKFLTQNKSFAPVEEIEKVNTENYTELETKINGVLDKYVRPAVAQDGGDVTYQEFKDGVLYVKMIGSCHGCPSSVATLKGGIERMMQNMVPEVHTVEAV